MPFVSSLHGRPSTNLWEDELGVVHDIQQGDGGEQGDALMPMLFIFHNIVPHTSQPDPHVASGHILIVSLSTMQKDWLQHFAPMFGGYV